MEKLDIVIQHSGFLGFLLWGGLVGAFIYLPTWLPNHSASFSILARNLCYLARNLCYFGFCYTIKHYCLFPLHRLYTMSPTPPLFEVTALGLVSAWVWLEATKQKRQHNQHPISQQQIQDLLNVVRLTLWLTMSLLPLVHR